MHLRSLYSNKSLFLITLPIRNFGFLSSSSNAPKTSNDLKTLENLSEKLKARNLDSQAFFKKAQQTHQNLYANLSSKSNPTLAVQSYKDINRFCILLSDSIKYLNAQVAFETFKMLEKELNQPYIEKATLDFLIKELSNSLQTTQIPQKDMEYLINSVYKLLARLKNEQSLNLFIHLLKENDYHKSFEQEYLETIDKIISDTKTKQAFYSQNIVDLDALNAFVQIASIKYPKLSSLHQISHLFNLQNASSTRIVNTSLEQQQQPLVLDEDLKHLTSHHIQFPSKIQILLDLLQAYDQAEKPKILDAFRSNIDPYFEGGQVPFEELVSIIEDLPLLKTRVPHSILQFLLDKMMDYIGSNLHVLDSLEFIHLIALLINSNVHLKSLRSKNLVSVAMIKAITNRVNSLQEIIYILPLLLNFGVFSAEMTKKLAALDTVNKLKFSNIDLIYYISAYVKLYSKAPGYNKIIFAGLKTIEELIEKIHSRFTYEEKCLLILQTKYLSSHNRNFFIMKPVLEDLGRIPQKWFAGVVNNLVNSCYFMVDKDNLMIELTKRMEDFDHKDLVLIGKALCWLDIKDAGLWRNIFERLNKLHKKIFLENILWMCDFYQILYSLKVMDKNLYTEIVEHNREIDFERIERSYFERPKLVTTDEVTKYEFEIELAFQDMNVENQRQKTIGIHRVDFIIEPDLIIELYGRHHFTERNVLNGSSKWRENQLAKLGYRVVGIVLQDWNDLPTTERKHAFLREKISQ